MLLAGLLNQKDIVLLRQKLQIDFQASRQW
jgi:hypothetical protein